MKAQGRLSRLPEPRTPLDSQHVYTLSELIDLAQSHNPETRVAWEAAKIRASQLGIARGDLYPTIAAAAIALTTRQGVLFGTDFVRQTLGLAREELDFSYLVLDFGARRSRIDISQANLLTANFTFNQTHLDLIYRTTEAFYRYLAAQAQEEAARANLTNAQTIREAVESRLVHGLATLPDALEARSSAAQAEYDLQSALGAEDTARGVLLSTIAVAPSSAITVQPLADLTVPDRMTDSVEDLTRRALQQRPDLLARLSDLEGAQQAIRGARSAFFPSLNLEGFVGEVRAYGRQSLLPEVYAGPVENWSAQLSLRWRLFDGGQRRNELARAHEERRRAEDDLNVMRDRIEEEVWRAYADTKTALRRREAAAALLITATESYSSSLEAYKYGVRSLLDVVSAQRILAQARAQDVAARTDVLGTFANLSFRTADSLHRKP